MNLAPESGSNLAVSRPSALIATMKYAGYKVIIQAITCDVEEAVRRNLVRGNDKMSAYFVEPFKANG